MSKFSKQDWALGAIYRMARKRRLDKATVSHLIETRAGLPAAKATQLAGLWFTTEPLRPA